MDQDETWRGGRPRLWPHCVRWGPTSPSPQRGTAPNFWPMSPNGRPSQLLLSTCCIYIVQFIQLCLDLISLVRWCICLCKSYRLVLVIVICWCVQVHSQLSADAACFIPSSQWRTPVAADISAAVSSSDGVLQQSANITQPFTSNQQVEQW